MEVYLFWVDEQLAHRPAQALPLPLTQHAWAALAADERQRLPADLMREVLFGCSDDSAGSWSRAQQIAEAALHLGPVPDTQMTSRWPVLMDTGRLRLRLAHMAREVAVLERRLHLLRAWMAGKGLARIVLPPGFCSPAPSDEACIVFTALMRNMPDALAGQEGLYADDDAQDGHAAPPWPEAQAMNMLSDLQRTGGAVCLMATRGLPHALPRLEELARKEMTDIVILHEADCGHWPRKVIEREVQRRQLPLRLHWLTVPVVALRLPPDDRAERGAHSSLPLESWLAAMLPQDFFAHLYAWAEELEALLPKQRIREVILSEHVSDGGAFCLDLARRQQCVPAVYAHSGWPLDSLHRWSAQHLQSIPVRACHPLAVQAYRHVGVQAVLDERMAWHARWRSAAWLAGVGRKLLRRMVRRPPRIGVLLTTGQARFASDICRFEELESALATLLREGRRQDAVFRIRLREAEDHATALKLLCPSLSTMPPSSLAWERVGNNGLAAFFRWSDVIVELGAPTTATFRAICSGVPVLARRVPTGATDRPAMPELPAVRTSGGNRKEELIPSALAWGRLLVAQMHAFCRRRMCS